MNKKSQSGQVLLIIIMLMATVMAISFSLSFTSQTETQVTKLEEESKRALAAAEALLEASLANTAGTYTLSDLSLNTLESQGFTGSATITAALDNTFVTPLLQKDEQYTFYTSDYNPATNQFSNPSTATINIYFHSETNCPAVELTYIKNNNLVEKREVLDPCSQIQNSDHNLTISSSSPENTFNQAVFQYQKSTPINLAGNYKLIIIRNLFNPTKIGVREVNGANIPSQGKINTAQAQTKNNVSSSISLFQSYPQIPADFFVTSF